MRRAGSSSMIGLRSSSAVVKQPWGRPAPAALGNAARHLGSRTHRQSVVFPAEHQGRYVRSCAPCLGLESWHVNIFEGKAAYCLDSVSLSLLRSIVGTCWRKFGNSYLWVRVLIVHERIL